MILQPRYTVLLDDVTEPGKHWYSVKDMPGYEKLVGTTTPLGVIDKPGLVVWARNKACDSILHALEACLASGDVGAVDPVWVKEQVAAARRRPDRERDDAAALGILVHSLIDRFVKGDAIGPEEIPEAAKPALFAFMEWWNSEGLEFLLPDTKVASLKHRFGGSLDALARRKSNGNIVLLDWKTSNHTYDTHALQAGGGYHIALEETYGVYAQEAWVIRFDKKLPVRFHAHQVADIERCRRNYLLTLQLYREMQQTHFVPKRKPKTVKEVI